MTENPNLEFDYQVAKRVYSNSISIKEGISLLIENRNFNPSSANTVIRTFHKLLLGEKFTRTLSNVYFEYFLFKIYNDFGIAKLNLAVKAIFEHIDYIKEKGNSKVKLKKILERYSDKILFNEKAKIEIEKTDEIEQEEIAENFVEENRNLIIQQLKSINPSEPQIIFINGKAYKRDNKIIAQIKFIRNYECQICSLYILKSNGKKYIEAAHIIPKAQKGQEVPSNILLLCPNHHKEFDFGLREILLHDDSKIQFRLNDIEHTINLGL